MDVVGDPRVDLLALPIVITRTFYIKFFWARVVNRIFWNSFSWERFTQAWGGLK